MLRFLRSCTCILSLHKLYEILQRGALLVWLPAQLCFSSKLTICRWSHEREVLSWWLTAADYFSPAGIYSVYLRSAPSCLCPCFLSAQCELRHQEEERMPGTLLPPHQTCPLPRPSLTMIHTQRESYSCLIWTICPLDNDLPACKCPCMHAHKCLNKCLIYNLTWQLHMRCLPLQQIFVHVTFPRREVQTDSLGQRSAV